MFILLMGLNYRSAPIEIRERFSIAEDRLEESIRSLSGAPAFHEAVLVSTCNRTEVYAVVSDLSAGVGRVLEFLHDVSALPIPSIREYVYMETDLQAVRHLHRVVTGLDSMVIGETQILGQVRSAFLFAQSAGATGSVFNQLFRSAVSFAKRMQTETGIGQSAVSVSYAAVSLARKVFATLAEKTVLVIGAGKMSELTLTHLCAEGIKKVIVANRTLERAASMAEKFGGYACEMSQLQTAMKEADIVISSTGSTGFVVTQDTMADVIRKRKQRPLFLIDIAVPRDIDPVVGRLDNVYVYDIDDLQEVVAEGVALRHQEALRVEELIEQEMAAFSVWRAEQDAVPLIAELREKAMSIQQSVLESLLRKMPNLDEQQKKVLEKHTASIVNQLLRDPIANIKELATEPGGVESLQTVARVFGLTGDLSFTPNKSRQDGDALFRTSKVFEANGPCLPAEAVRPLETRKRELGLKTAIAFHTL